MSILRLTLPATTSPDSTTRRESLRLPFFLALEEWAAARIKSLGSQDAVFFAWHQGPDTVICGRNQDIALEVDADHCRREGIDIVRRRSGGGAVVADAGNIMFSYVAPLHTDVETFFHDYSLMLARALRQLGYDAVASGRNDICISGRKVSGGAFYNPLPGMGIAHSTMLVDAPSPHILAALTPSRAKLESHGVKSVSARISSLREHGCTDTPEELAEKICSSICTGVPIELDEKILDEIRSIEARYYNPEFLRLN